MPDSVAPPATEYPTTAASCHSPRGWRAIQCPHGSVVWVPNRCRSCPGCLYLRRARIKARIRLGIARSIDADGTSSSAMLTLTSRPGTANVTLMSAWNRFRQWLRRRLPDLQYACVKERGSLHGMFHLHIIVIGWTYIHQSELSDAWRRASGAFRVDIRRLYGDPNAAAAYASKYVSKALDHTRDLRKMVTYSRGWPREPRAGWTLTAWRSEGPQRPVPPSAGRELGGGPLLIYDALCNCLAALDEPADDGARVTPEEARAMRALILGRTTAP